ncbi:MAG: carbohydrate ABC transporter permease [Clostridia bacterium]|nr:carbohydrate ABC transporter permease [Clostridia bacterium]
MNAENVKKAKFRNNPAADFERTPLKVKLKSKLTSLFFLKKIVWIAFRLVLLVGIAFQILKPYLQWLPESIMAPDDFIDVTVQMVPKSISFDMYKAVWHELHYFNAFFNTLTLSVTVALIQTFICCFIAYGLAKFKFKGNKLVFMAVILSLLIPHKTLQLSMQMNFMDFDVLGIFHFLNGGGINLFGFSYTNDFLAAIDIIPESWTIFTDGRGAYLLDTNWPLIILSLFGLAFKNGLYIFLLRQFFFGVPSELEESAYIDGSGIMKTFFTIILPLSVPMLITVFLFAFSWQWTDVFYTQLFSIDSSKSVTLLKDLVGQQINTLSLVNTDQATYLNAAKHTCGLMVIAPLVVVYLFFQKYLVQGIERSGLTAD